MRIGELAERTGVPARMLRYYEQQSLLTPDRAPNGYRDYGEPLVDRVIQIRGLLDAGLPTRIIKQILPCLTGPREIMFCDITPDLVETLERERDALDKRVRCLARNRDAITDYLDALKQRA
jgi:DNA-binding transcriptional MerR regulator